MASRNEEKEKTEMAVLSAARQAGAGIPPGGAPGKEPGPDFVFADRGRGLGVELSEILCPGRDCGGKAGGAYSPLAKEKFHQEIVREAQNRYYSVDGVKPVRVDVRFSNQPNANLTQAELEQRLYQYVHETGSPVASKRTPVPFGFSSIAIISDAGDWRSHECVSFEVGSIKQQVSQRILEKNGKVATYRRHLPVGAHMWLLLYTRPGVTRYVPVPDGVHEWRFQFDFERVLWFTSDEENRVIELNRLPSAHAENI